MDRTDADEAQEAEPEQGQEPHVDRNDGLAASAGAVTGAAVGGAIGGPPGALIGAVSGTLRGVLVKQVGDAINRKADEKGEQIVDGFREPPARGAAEP